MARIVACLQEQPPEQPIVVMAHNGPAGLGSSPHDPCGVDFKLHKDGSAPLLPILHAAAVSIRCSAAQKPSC